MRSLIMEGLNKDSECCFIYFICVIYFRDVYMLPVEIIMTVFYKMYVLPTDIVHNSLCLRNCEDPSFAKYH